MIHAGVLVAGNLVGARLAERNDVTMANTLERAAREELRRAGRQLRAACPRGSHAAWRSSDRRKSPVDLLRQSSIGRIRELLPIRYGRMVKSPFAFYRGAALNMAEDLADTPTTGLRVQACGDCHLANFGGFATPERRVIVDINDLDETLPAPWEWDVKRLAASFVLASRDNGHRASDAREAALACVRSYRKRMAELAELPVLDIWYSGIDVEELLPTIGDADARARLERRVKKARGRDVREYDLPKLAYTASGRPTLKHVPPLLVRPDGPRRTESAPVRAAFLSYKNSLAEHQRCLLDHFELIDIALRVVGVGSVGTRCFILLLMARDGAPLFLQVKEARPSVLARHAGESRYSNHGQRVVVGHHLVQAASDPFLGYTAGRARSYYVRQLRDMKIKPLIELFTPAVMLEYADLCGRILARAHARSGQPALISGYLGGGDAFDVAVAEFATTYADEAERDHEMLAKAVRRGELPAELDV